VRNGKAYIITDRCIDCGECIRNCQAHAKKAVSDPLDIIKKYDFKVALPAPSFYGQFRDLPGPEYV
jgi:ferredoxin